MGRENFEKLIADKFLDKGIEPSSSVWTKIDGTLNSNLISDFSKKNRIYKMLSVAAMLIALISISNDLFLDIKNSKDSYQVESYNALKEGHYSISKTPSNLVSFSPTSQRAFFLPPIDDEEKKEVKISPLEYPKDPKEIDKSNYHGLLTSLRPIEKADIIENFYSYKRPSYLAL